MCRSSDEFYSRHFIERRSKTVQKFSISESVPFLAVLVVSGNMQNCEFIFLVLLNIKGAQC